MAARPFLPFAMCNKNFALPNNILLHRTPQGSFTQGHASPSIWAALRHTTKI
jgi:hypothetical protein